MVFLKPVPAFCCLTEEHFILEDPVRLLIIPLQEIQAPEAGLQDLLFLTDSALLMPEVLRWLMEKFYAALTLKELLNLPLIISFLIISPIPSILSLLLMVLLQLTNHATIQECLTSLMVQQCMPIRDSNNIIYIHP